MYKKILKYLPDSIRELKVTPATLNGLQKQNVPLQNCKKISQT